MTLGFTTLYIYIQTLKLRIALTVQSEIHFPGQ